jgi:hypothetical protein
MSIYRVPLRRVYKNTHSPADPSWDQLYGKKRCAKCHKPFEESDPYRISEKGGFEHIDCPEPAGRGP